MKNNFFSIQIISLLILSSFESIVSRDQQSSNNHIEISSESNFNQEDKLSLADRIQLQRMQEEALDELKKQAGNITCSLEQVEQILIANKINFDESTVTKKQLLQEIKLVKYSIEDIYTQLESLPTPEAFPLYIMINKCFLDFLLPCMESNICLLTAENFSVFMGEVFNPESTWANEYQQIPTENVLMSNEQNCLKLLVAAENVGLTSFNKAFRAFQDNPVLFNKSAMSLVGYGAGIIGTTALACAIISYVQTTTPYRDITIKLADDKAHDPVGYIEWIKNHIGRQIDTTTAMQAHNTNNNDAIDAARKAFGLFNHIDTACRKYTGDFITPITLFLTTQGKPLYEYTKEKSVIAYKKSINYLRGEVDKTTNSMFESNTQKVYFQDMIGSEHLEELAQELADFIKHPHRYQNSGTVPITGILLTGPSQTGKSYFAQALQTLINEENDTQAQDVKFKYITQELIYTYGLDRIFEYARENAPFILFIDEIDMIGVRRDKDHKTTNDLMTNMSGLSNDKDKQVIVIGATNRPEELDFALLKDGRFGKQIRFECPSYESRKKYLIKSLTKRNISVLDENYIDAIAQETEGSTYNTFDKIIRYALMRAKKDSRPLRDFDFEAALDSELRHIHPNTSMNIKEKEVVAVYHAGQSVARHILSTEQQVVKVTIHAVDKPVQGKEGFAIETTSNGNANENVNYIQTERPRAIKLGHVFTLSSSNNKELLSNQEQENELLALLAGQAALELTKGQCYDNFAKEDRAMILHALESKLSQGTSVTDEIRQQAIYEKDRLYTKIRTILELHTHLVQDITQALLEKNTINRSEFIKLTENNNQ